MDARRIAAVLAVASFVLLGAAPASANHKWAKYHWARTASTDTIALVLNDQAVNGWNKADVRNNWNTFASEVPISLSSGTAGVDITATSGEFGYTGWLGRATILVDRKGHIGSGTVDLNETYWNDASFGLTANDKQSVYCQELGHTLGLSHNHSPRFDADSTCMNDFLFQLTPNWHDEAQLVAIYDHADGFSSFANVTPSSPDRVTVIVPPR